MTKVIKIKTRISRTDTENLTKNSEASIAARRILEKLRHILKTPSRLPSVNSIASLLLYLGLAEKALRCFSLCDQ